MIVTDLHRSGPLRRTVWSATFCLLGQIAVAQTVASQDISQMMTPAELGQADQTIRDCLADNSPGVLDSHYAHSSESGDSLQLIYSWQADGAKRKVQFSAQFGRESSALDWQLGQIMLGGEQVVGSQEQPIHFTGFLTDDSVESVLKAASGLWAAMSSDPFLVSRIISSQTPPIYCDTTFPDVSASETIYDVSILNLSKKQRQQIAIRPNTASLSSSGGTNNSFRIRVARNSDGLSATTEVNCDNGNDCDAALLGNLRDGLDRPISDSDIAARLRAAYSVLPEEFSAAVVEYSQPGLFGPVELFHVSFGETAISQNRSESGSVICSRMAGSDMEWNCQHMRSMARQRVAGQSTPITLMLASVLSENDVETIVLALKRELVKQPDIDLTRPEIQISTLFMEENIYTAAFIHGQASYRASFTFGGGDEFLLESVNLEQRWGEQ